jgi:hypothetical protein
MSSSTSFFAQTVEDAPLYFTPEEVEKWKFYYYVILELSVEKISMVFLFSRPQVEILSLIPGKYVLAAFIFVPCTHIRLDVTEEGCEICKYVLLAK